MKRRHDPMRFITGFIYLSVAIAAIVLVLERVREQGVLWGVITWTATLVFLFIGVLLSDRLLREEFRRAWRERRTGR